jgi:hypothetical protein
VPGAPLEHSKLLWAMDKPHRAIIEMQQASSYQLAICARTCAERVLDRTWEHVCIYHDCSHFVQTLIKSCRTSTDRGAASGQQHVE